MSRARVLIARVRGLIGRNPSEQDLDDELRCHLEMRVEYLLRTGLPPEEHVPRHSATSAALSRRRSGIGRYAALCGLKTPCEMLFTDRDPSRETGRSLLLPFSL
jgi:hypothetical protein